jgi:hypothetical protein
MSQAWLKYDQLYFSIRKKEFNRRFIDPRRGVSDLWCKMREIMEIDKKREERIVTKGFFGDRVSIVSPPQRRYHGNRVIIDTEHGRIEVQNVKLQLE